MAKHLGISDTTLSTYRKKHKEIDEAVARGRLKLKAMLMDQLLKMVLGNLNILCMFRPFSCIKRLRHKKVYVITLPSRSFYLINKVPFAPTSQMCGEIF